MQNTNEQQENIDAAQTGINEEQQQTEYVATVYFRSAVADRDWEQQLGELIDGIASLDVIDVHVESMPRGWTHIDPGAEQSSEPKPLTNWDEVAKSLEASGDITISDPTLTDPEWRTIHNALSVYQCQQTAGTADLRQRIQQLMDKVRDNYIATI